MIKFKSTRNATVVEKLPTVIRTNEKHRVTFTQEWFNEITNEENPFLEYGDEDGKIYLITGKEGLRQSGKAVNFTDLLEKVYGKINRFSIMPVEIEGKKMYQVIPLKYVEPKELTDEQKAKKIEIGQKLALLRKEKLS
jgi:uncharacterized protein (DUF2344 family)